MTAVMSATHWLLLRGLAREKRHFGAFPEQFARTLDVKTATMDLPGFGAERSRPSPTSVRAIVDDLRARHMRERNEGERWSIFALSLGGMVALDWAARFPDDFHNVVVGNTSAADQSKPWERFSTSLLLRLPQVLTAAPLDRERTILRITSNRSVADNEPIARAWADYYREHTPTRTAFARQLYAASRSTLPRSIKAPVLVLTSSADRLVSHRCSQNIARALAAPIHIHDQAGHDLTLDAPDWVCDKIACSL